MTAEISPKSGPVGTPIIVEVKGIGWRSLVNSWDLLYDNNFTGWISSVTRHGSARFTIPATGGPGMHILQVLHGELTFPYRNMQQSPEPDRPRWAIPFTVTVGAPVLPPPERHARQNPPVPPRQDELVMMPQSSGVGEAVLVRSDGLVPGTSYQLNWTRVVGNRMTGAGWQELSTVVAESKADSAGHAEFRFDVPDDLGGAHGLWMDTGSAKKTGRYWITPTARPSSALVGTGAVGAALQGFSVSLSGDADTANGFQRCEAARPTASAAPGTRALKICCRGSPKTRRLRLPARESGECWISNLVKLSICTQTCPNSCTATDSRSAILSLEQSF
jgi:hypothetical protein